MCIYIYICMQCMYCRKILHLSRLACRTGFRGLVFWVQGWFRLDPTQGASFAICSKCRNLIKKPWPKIVCTTHVRNPNKGPRFLNQVPTLLNILPSFVRLIGQTLNPKPLSPQCLAYRSPGDLTTLDTSHKFPAPPVSAMMERLRTYL